ICLLVAFFFSSRRRHTRCLSDWSSDVCSSDLRAQLVGARLLVGEAPSPMLSPPHALNPKLDDMDRQPGILARGPWDIADVASHWTDEPYEPGPEKIAAADAAIKALRDRGSPSHDGVAARMAGHRDA